MQTPFRPPQGLLVKLKLFDPDQTLSLTNVMLMVLIGKVAFSPIDWTQLAALFLAILAYNGKKFIRYKEVVRGEQRDDAIVKHADHVQATTSRIENLGKQVGELSSAVNAIKSFNR